MAMLVYWSVLLGFFLVGDFFFTDSTIMVNHQVSPQFGEYFSFFPTTLSKSKIEATKQQYQDFVTTTEREP